MKFTEFPYQRPDCDQIIRDLDSLIVSFNEAGTFSDQLAIYKRIETLQKDYGTMRAIASVRFTINTNDEFYKGEDDYFNSKGPLLSEKFVKFEKMILESPFKDDFAKEIGDIYIKNLELSVKGFSSKVTELVQKENELTTKYQRLYASAKVEFDGKTMALPMLGPYKSSSDRNIRKLAFEVEGKFFDENQEAFDEIFDSLVKNRTEQAKMLGFNNYMELGYVRRRRNCYDAKAVANFRKQILEDVVPLVKKFKANQGKRIGVEDMKYYDDTFMFSDGNPTPKGNADELLSICKKMYTEMSSETAEFIKVMFDQELFDVVSREGKAPGGYCTKFMNYKVPFIFSNFNGTSGDVDVLTHEAGHALAGYLSRNMEYSAVMSPTHEACEVHSMAMEYLTGPWHEAFFKEDINKYTLNQAESDIAFLPYGTMVDYFQEIVYTNPDMTPQERNEAWAKLESQFRPYLDFDNLPFYSRGAGWQRQLHIYIYPFYYIDYVLASTVSMQIQTINLKDSKKAWETYLTFTKMAGTKTFLDLTTSSGLQSPMEDGCLKEVCEAMQNWVSDLNSK